MKNTYRVRERYDMFHSLYYVIQRQVKFLWMTFWIDVRLGIHTIAFDHKEEAEHYIKNWLL